MKKNLNKADLAEAVYNKIGYSQKICEDLVEEFLNTIKNNLIKGQGIKIQGFGKFVLKDKKSRKGRNPQTGEPLTIAARRALRFQYSSNFKKKF